MSAQLRHTFGGDSFNSHVVDKGGPTEKEEHARQESSTLQHRSSQNHGSGRDEGEAKCSIWKVSAWAAAEQTVSLAVTYKEDRECRCWPATAGQRCF